MYKITKKEESKNVSILKTLKKFQGMQDDLTHNDCVDRLLMKDEFVLRTTKHWQKK